MSRADVFADDGAVVDVAHPIHPARGSRRRRKRLVRSMVVADQDETTSPSGKQGSQFFSYQRSRVNDI